ncbi:flavin-containing monooxygenase [Marinobacter goseongensis]|jgi:cation diffusion facilitator CzcD-associated flavoprotein CzcO|uniref:flavin-containing monooxygenase n=1 Tax=Marinobacter goseongensis TaxID=453838 RepID=UPI00200506A1|nr:NAD(P)/FAD-dependent oxidoreductase [Marinobacter goseongensis]MCK7550744.1 NAD(P)/FAD-dependent oxidoreductase [Marinobacter goseongensis]
MATPNMNAAANAEHIYDTFIVGAGISGLATAIKLKKTGYHNFKIIEKASRVGGTWRENTYPGCGCDVPSSLYSYSFAPSSRWSNLFAKQPEILDYLEKVSDQFGINPLIEFDNELERAAWDNEHQLWRLDTSSGQYLSRTVVFATGPITESKIPPIPGLDSFTGEMFHSARWNHDYDLTGKRVAVIGTGASAIQFVPRIQPKAGELHVFQRTAPWVLPKPDMVLGDNGKRVIDRFPVIQSTWRKAVASSLNVINFGLRNPAFLKPVNVAARQLLKLQIRDPQLRKAVTPNYDIGCKRLLFANDYYEALQAANTTLIPSGLVKVEGNTVIAANGERREVDVIIWGTGFDVSHPPIGNKVFNANGERWADLWKDSSPEAYLGTTLANSPNAFLILGPNVLVYDSFIRLAEAQLDYIIDGLWKIREKGISRLTVKPSVLKQHNERVQKNLQTTVFNAGGCSSYYLDQNGRNFAAWPWSLGALKRRLNAFRLKDYEVEFAAPNLS